jgi:hypothetical protein
MQITKESLIRYLRIKGRTDEDLKKLANEEASIRKFLEKTNDPALGLLLWGVEAGRASRKQDMRVATRYLFNLINDQENKAK